MKAKFPDSFEFTNKHNAIFRATRRRINGQLIDRKYWVFLPNGDFTFLAVKELIEGFETGNFKMKEV